MSAYYLCYHSGSVDEALAVTKLQGKTPFILTTKYFSSAILKIAVQHLECYRISVFSF